MLKDIINEHAPNYDEIFIIGYSHGARLIYDLYDHNWEHPKIKGVIIADMGPERPEDAAHRRAKRNQHSPRYSNLTEAVIKLTHFFNGHGRTLPEDFVLNVINHNFTMTDNGENCGLQFSYDPRSMFGYCDEIKSNPRMNSWKGFKKINVPILFLLGMDTNTVLPDLLNDMQALKKGTRSISDIALSRKLHINFASASKDTTPSPLYILKCEGTGHYPEPHRLSHFSIINDFLNNPNDFSIKSALTEITKNKIMLISHEIIKNATTHEGILPLTPVKEDSDLLHFFSKTRILPIS
jgi:pimeloyl-ACP methyl ester carboxylesterase